MFQEDDVERWNEIFPESKIRESDLAHPTDLFLVRTLVPYLKSFGYKVVPPFPTNVEINLTQVENISFLIKLSRQIESILKIPSKANTFTYADLLRPTPKKTSKILCVLLNYAYHFQTFKCNVFQMASEKIKEREELLKKLDEIKINIEERNNYVEKIKNGIATQSIQLEEVSHVVERLQKFYNKHKREESILQKMVAELETKLNDLNEKKLNLKKIMVPDAEAVTLQAQVDKVHNHIEEITQKQAVLETNLRECAENINSMEDLIKNIEEAKEILPMKLLTNYKEIHEKVKQKKNECKALNNKMKELMEKIEEMQATIKALEKKYTIKKKQFEQEKKLRMQTIENKKKKLKENTVLCERLQLEEHALACKVEEQKDIKEILAKNITEIMLTYKENSP